MCWHIIYCQSVNQYVEDEDSCKMLMGCWRVCLLRINLSFMTVNESTQCHERPVSTIIIQTLWQTKTLKLKWKCHKGKCFYCDWNIFMVGFISVDSSWNAGAYRSSDAFYILQIQYLLGRVVDVCISVERSERMLFYFSSNGLLSSITVKMSSFLALILSWVGDGWMQ